MRTCRALPLFFRPCERKRTADVLIGLQMYDADPASARRQRAAAEALRELPGVEAVNLQFRHGLTFESPGIATAAEVLDDDEASRADRATRSAIVAASIAFFLAELGDKTQLATLLFAADQTVSKLAVFIAASAALIVATGIGVLAGGLVAQHVSPAALKYAAGAGFIAIGIWTLVRA